MLQLLQPVWLITLTGLMVPVLIHLWNLKPGKVLKIGSISLVTESNREYKRSFTLSDILLLIIRSLLILFLSITLAKPAWRKPVIPALQKGWILLRPENKADTYLQFKPLIDSLLKTGMEIHYFEDGFVRGSLFESPVAGPDSSSGSPSYWNLVSALDRLASKDVPLYLFTDNYLSHFRGDRPSLSSQLHWYTYTPAEATVKSNIPDMAGKSPLRITIFTGSHPEDARYLTAAIEAIQQYSKRPVRLTVTASVAEIKKGQDWLFWLSENALTREEVAGHVFVYKAGVVKHQFSRITPARGLSFSPIALYKSVLAATPLPDSSLPVWEDGFGNPVLSVEKKTGTSWYYFYSRFNPEWNELTWTPQFPELIYTLLVRGGNPTTGNDTSDKRIIDRNQLLPVFLQQDDQKKQPASFSTTDLCGLSWLLVLLLFIAERLYSFYYYKRKEND